MKLTDLLRRNLKALAESEALDDIIDVVPLPDDFPSDDDNIELKDVENLLEILENNFANIDYTDNYSLIDFLADLSETVSDEEDLEDIDKQILTRTFVFLIDNEHWKLECHTGYYNFPRSNEMKKVQRKTRKVDYFG